jgi:hypothetical protein
MTVPTLPNKCSFSIVSPSSSQTKEFAQNKFKLSINSDIRPKSITNAHMRQAIILNGRTCKGSNYWLTSPPDLRSRSIIDAAPFIQANLEHLTSSTDQYDELDPSVFLWFLWEYHNLIPGDAPLRLFALRLGFQLHHRKYSALIQINR